MEPGTHNIQINKQLFGPDFIWGVSTSAFQVEGSSDADGKGQSIWDAFSAKKGKILNGDKPGAACNFYNQYQKDIDIIKQLGIPNFRFSISWSRILPNGTGEINEAGIAYYNRVIDYCLQQGIQPWVTLYHWDIPQALELKGGWTNREVVEWYTSYVIVCAKHFGDRVKHWMMMNEPTVFTAAGYFLGIHAPGRTGIRNFLPAIHYVVLSIVAGAKALRSVLPDAEIGTTFSCAHIEPRSDKKKDIDAAKRTDVLVNRLFIEPILGLGYPDKDFPVLKGIEKFYKPGDQDNMKYDFDFIGIQNYTREIVEYSFFTPYLNARLVKAEERHVPTTAMKWEVYPAAIYQMIKKFNGYPQIKKLYITENGAAFHDEVIDGKINDDNRIDYLQANLQQVLKAKNEGYKIGGYFIWTLTDNFEWAEGFHPRFGLVYVDFKTQQRIIKSSGYWYRDFLSVHS